MITKRSFGTIPELPREAFIYTLVSGDYALEVSELGCTWQSFVGPDRNGKPTDILLGFDDLSTCFATDGSVGKTVGRYGNRIAKGEFTLDGVDYHLAVNSGPNHLHGGIVGFGNRLWDSTVNGETLIMEYVSADGEEGYPGTLSLSVAITLSDAGRLCVEYTATTDKPTVLNPTNHSYFNLNGALSKKSTRNHSIRIFANEYCEADDNTLVNGNFLPVEGTPLDLREWANVGERLDSGYPDLVRANGFDQNFVLKHEADSQLVKAAEVHSPDTGITLLCETTQPGVQFYSGNWLNDTMVGKGGVHYFQNYGLCLETQHFPNSPCIPFFPTTVLRPGETYEQTTVYTFTAE